MTDDLSQLMQRARDHHRRGDLEQAACLYGVVLTREPTHADALHLTGVVAHQQGRSEDAVALIERAIERNPRVPAFHNNLGMALAALGRADDAEAAYRAALALAPNFSDALLNLGNRRAAQSRFDEAVALLERSVAAAPREPRGYFILGSARWGLGDAQGALGALRRATELGADFAEVHCRIADISAAIGDQPAATAHYAEALVRDGDHLAAQQGLLACLDTLTLDSAPERLEAVVAPLLRVRSLNHRSLGHAVARLVERKYGLDDRFDPDRSGEALRALVLNDEVVSLYLQRTSNMCAPLERLLTVCRSAWLEQVHARATLMPADLVHACAVALQCFLNEFVWAVTANEESMVDDIPERIVDSCIARSAPDAALASRLVVYACYRPLWRIDCADRLAETSADAWPPALREVIRVCLAEPLHERESAKRIVSTALPRDDVSRAVQAQYEENPYPRWFRLSRSHVRSIEQHLQDSCPGYSAPPVLRGPLRVLVAGCGTGMDAINTALHVDNAHVTAIDLSRASLAYAMRKREEYGLENLDLLQADILEFDAPGAPYHVILCTGVLHHMRSPAAGLERLVEILVPEGLIKLGLYSRIAREPLMRAREVIRESGLGSDAGSIRAFRQRVFRDGAGGPFADLMRSADFYSMSACRDLLFHVQESQLTLIELSALLSVAGLELLGFELPVAELQQGFHREHPDAALDDLQAWHAYEEQHPQIFRGMYQFWCRKPGGGWRSPETAGVTRR